VTRRLGLGLLAGAALALGAIGPASARADLGSRYGGTLVVGIGSDFTAIDPTVSRTPFVTLGGLCQRLFEYESDHGKVQLIPVLAAAPWTLSPDKLSYTVRLRQGIQFNDGTPFNAQAVIATYQRYLTYPGTLLAGLFDSVDSVTAFGSFTLVFHLKGRNASFTPNLPVLSPTAFTSEGASFAANPVCVDPFMVDHWTPGDNLTLVKSPYYYKRTAIYLDKIVFKPIPDPAAAFAALQAGDIQVWVGVPTSLLPAVQHSSNLQLLQTPPLGWNGIVINIGNRAGVGNLPYQSTGTALATSTKLRQAFEEAINRTLLAKVVFGGYVVPQCTAIPPGNTAWYDATRIPCIPFDPRHARKLVAASGVTRPTVHLLTGNSDQTEAEFIQAEEAAVGINVVIDPTDGPTLAARLLAGDFDAATRGFPGDFDPSGQIYRFLSTSGDRNYSGYSNPRMDYVLANSLKAVSTDARATDYRVAMQIAQTDRPIIYLYAGPGFTAVSTNVTGVEKSANGVTLFANAQYK
jgi:peptide/nickel transport system substrate-binding protein